MCEHAWGERSQHLVISPFTKQNNVDHTVNDQTSILRFIEDNWGLPRIGDQSFDALANSILGHFDFTKAHLTPVLLNPPSREVVKDPGN
jgi:phospholipase C